MEPRMCVTNELRSILSRGQHQRFSALCQYRHHLQVIDWGWWYDINTADFLMIEPLLCM